MKVFIFKIFLLVLIVGLILTTVFICPGTSTTDMATGINKLDMLQNKRSPRIIFIGGSNLLTLKSHVIEKETGMSVANLSMWYGLNYKDFLEVLKPYLKAGDTVVFVIEYCVYHTDMSLGGTHESDQFLFFISPMKRAWYHLVNLDAINGARVFIELCQLKARASVKYIRTGAWYRFRERGVQDYNLKFSKNGDFLLPWKIKRPLDYFTIEHPYELKRKYTFLNEFSDYARKRNIRAYLSFPPYPAEYYDRDKEKIREIYTSLKDFLAFPVLDKPEDYILPEKYFRDSVYHADGEGALIRVRKLIKALKVELGK